MKNKKIKLLISFIATLSLFINLSKPSIFLDNLIDINYLFGLIIFYGIYKFINNFKYKKNTTIFIISMIISIIYILGYFYQNYSNLKYLFTPYIQLIKSIIVFIGFTIIFYYIIYSFFIFIKKIKKYKIKNKIYDLIFEKHPVISTIIILMIIYIPLLIIFYPGDIGPDGFDELKQFYTIETWSVNYVNLIDKNTYITTHHSVLHTYLIGFINDFGYNTINSNFGLFLNILLQVICTIAVLAYCMRAMKKLKVPPIIRIGIFLFYILSGHIILASLSIYKDILFSLSILLFSTILMEILILKEYKISKIIFLAIIGLTMSLLTKKGIYAYILVTICLLLIYCKKHFKKSLILFIPIIIYFILGSIIYPALNITPGSIREMLVVPIQQISRVVKYYENEINNTDKEIINNIIEFDKISEKYNPNSSDPIKNELFNKNYTNNELKEFLILWIKYFFKYPTTYISAFANEISGYFYLGNTITSGGYSTDAFRMNSEEITYTRTEWRENTIEKINNIYEFLTKVPVLNLIYVFAIYDWILVLAIVYIIKYSEKKYLIALIPTFTILLFLLISPVNNNRRYILPIIETIPMIIAYLSIIKLRKE